jgi:hypothetical protein
VTWRLLGLLALSAAACSTGEGTGAAAGPLYMLDCKGANGDLGILAAPEVFDLDPHFFAAEPIQAAPPLGVPATVNRLIIRLQRNGRSRELNDVLTFDVPDSREVARCVRGRVAGGVPDYDQTNCLQTANGPRLRVAPDALVRAYLGPHSTCIRQLVAAAVSGKVCNGAGACLLEPRLPDDGSWGSWIEISAFGAIAVSTDPPETREPVRDDFKVDFNEPLHASAFFLTLVDDVVVNGRRAPAAAQMGGTFAGFFEFLLQRGQGAQTFP